jgi:hypothetical protein
MKEVRESSRQDPRPLARGRIPKEDIVNRNIIRWLALALMVGACSDSSSTTEPEAPLQPAVNAISPERGTVGTEVRISGQNFTTSSVVHFGDIEAAAVELEAGSLFAEVPEGVTAGTRYDIRVTNGGVATATLNQAFEVVAPTLTRVNGVTRPVGLKGMTIILEGDAFGDRMGDGRVYFTGTDGIALEGVVQDPAEDWTNSFVVTAVPEEVGDTTTIHIETATGESGTVEFLLITSAAFSPSTINWTQTTDLPEPLQALGAVFVPVEDGDSPAKFVFAVGGADSLGVATSGVYRSLVQESGAIGEWDDAQPGLPTPRAYHTTVAATASTAALDTITTAAVIYAIGGIDEEDTVTSTVYHSTVGLDGAAGPWGETEALPQPLHSASAAIFRGFLYLTGGAGSDHASTTVALRAAVQPDGTLGSWEEMPELPVAHAHGQLVSFGPFLYVIGGETVATEPVQATQTTTESDRVLMARVSLRTGDLRDGAWSDVATMGKGRSKHGAVFAGGYLFVTSGIYSGQAGSSENIYSQVNSDGSIESWQGATGSNTIGSVLGLHLYNPAIISFTDASGDGHVLVLGGANRAAEGEASAAVTYY